MTRRWMGMGGLLGLGVLLTQALTACGGEPGAKDEEHGTLNLPLATHGPSGQRYRLRDATFEIRDPYGWSSGGEGGASSPNVVVVSSEDDPDADTLSVSLEQGYYVVELRPGWRMEKVDGDVATDVEATLLSGDSQWIYVSPHSTNWAQYQFGIGGREIWLNGDLNINIQVYENPDEYYGGGFGGANGGFGGSP